MAGRLTRSLAVFPTVPPFTAASADELLGFLAKTDISVPLRTEGRTTAHVERWSTARFLSTYARSELIAYPIDVTPRDRPDVLLAMPNTTVGIEITEGIPTNWARTTALHDHREYENAYGPGQFCYPRLRTAPFGCLTRRSSGS